MFRRMTLALAFLVILSRSAAAQPAEEPPPPPTLEPLTPSLSDRIGLASFLPEREAGSPRDGRWWASADYLFAFLRGQNFPVLATTSDPGTAKINAGVLGAAGSSTLFGGNFVNTDLRAGFRLGVGCWCNADQTLGVDAGFMMLESQASLFFRNADDGSILARPFININNATPQSIQVAFPGSSTGSLDIRASSGNFYGVHVDVTEKAIESDWFRLSSLLGYRFYRYDEGLRIQQIINTTDPNFVAGTQVVTNDSFSTRNEFHGLDLGFRTQFFWNDVSLDVLTKLAVGRVFRSFNANGDQTINAPGAVPIQQSGGVLALASNSGTFTSHDWKVVPEVGVTLGWQARANLHLRLGYSFLLLNGIARVADQVDASINPNLFPGNSLTGAARPSADHVRSNMWMQTVNVGVLFTY